MRGIIVRSGSATLRFSFPSSEVRIGSSADNDFVLPFSGVSRLHARAYPEGNSLRIVDVGSKNGLVLNGTRTPEAILRNEDIVQIGQSTLTIEDFSSSDGIAAIHIRPDVRNWPATSTDGETAIEDEASRVIRFLREADRLNHNRAALLNHLRSFFDLDSVAIVDVSHEEPAVEHLSGLVPPLEALIAAGKQTGTVRKAKLSDGSTAHYERRRKKLLVAIASRALPPWWGEALALIGEKLLGAPQSAASFLEAESRPLEFDTAFVPPASRVMRRLLDTVRATLPSGLDVLILGETGTGKELLARAIHVSRRGRKAPFIAINCAAIPFELLESQLFGIRNRVATGVDAHAGLISEASGGSLFLDEIGELAPPLQAKLLRVIQEREVLPIGGVQPRPVDLHVIAASNRPLHEEVRAGRFRADLFYRLAAISFEIPPLRERPEDIPALVTHFVEEAGALYARQVRGVSRKALSSIMNSSWPGNIRQLRHEIFRAVSLCPSGGILQSEHLSSTSASQVGSAPPGSLTLAERTDAFEREAVEQALLEARGNKSEAARRLGLTRNGLAKKLERLGIHSGGK